MILVIFSVKEAPFMHNPIHHNLLDDSEEQRVMCMITYDDFYWIVNSVNLISALIIIFQSYKDYIASFFDQYYNLFGCDFLLCFMTIND